MLSRGFDSMNQKSVGLHFCTNSIEYEGGWVQFFFTNIWIFKLSDVLEGMQYELKWS